MLAFNRNIVFLNEPALESSVCGTMTSLDEIEVIKDQALNLSALFCLQSPWVSMTGRKVRYYANVPFEKQTSVTSWALEVEDVVTLIWSSNPNTIRYIEGEKFTAKLLEFWVLHTFLPLALELAKVYHILHVSAVEINDDVIAFSAFSGGGKSTLTDYFIQKGHCIYGDDTIAIEEKKGSYSVIASYPFHRPYRQPEVLGYNIPNFATKAKSFSSMYVLDKSTASAKVCIEELTGIEKFEALYQSRFVTFEYMKKERYLFASKMAQKVKVYKIVVPWDLSRLEEVYQAILTHNGV